jgi:hypothetical protein
MGSSLQNDQRRTGQFFTPPEVARFLLELLGVLDPEARKCQTVIDPACGQGVFLEAAVDVLSQAPARAVGVDLYPQQGGIWDDPDGAVEQLVGDGLLEPSGERFDLVAGNPPFHGEALRCLADPDDPRGQRLAEAMNRQYTLWRGGVRDTGKGGPQMSLPGTQVLLSPKTVEQLARYPVELAFLDRFVTLCRPGGYVVVVLPEGVVANRRLQYARDWVQEHCELLAVVSLPRGTFRKSGTSAVTATLILRKRVAGRDATARTLLLDVERLDRLEGLLDEVRESVGEGGHVA